MSFRGCPVTQSLFALSASSSLLALWIGGPSFASSHLALSASSPASLPLKAVPSLIVWSHPADAFFGLALLFALRSIERFLGSRRFGGVAAALAAITLVLEVLLLLIFRPSAPLPSGAFFLSLGLLPRFFLDVPALHRFRLCGFPLSEKFFPYLLALQLVLASSSPLPATSALLAGVVARAVPSLGRLSPPDRVSAMLASLHAAITSMGGAGRRRRRGYARVDGGAPDSPFEGEALLQPAAAGPPPAAVNEEDVQRMVDMGFGEAQVREALRRAGGSPEVAMNLLLGS